jgi:mono/diheme cytochrome c family protein
MNFRLFQIFTLVASVLTMVGCARKGTDVHHSSAPPASQAGIITMTSPPDATTALNAAPTASQPEVNPDPAPMTSPVSASMPVATPMSDTMPAPTPKTDATPLNGRMLFLHNCAHCHGANAMGDEGPDLHHLDFTDEWIANRIRKGKAGQMTAFAGKLQPSEIAALVAYVQSLK